ncbi:MAG: class I SAM-dependent methyltransferase [candidate division Zixibacteria bacterium]
MPYYTEKLSALRLKRVYDIATPRVRQYLDAELDYALSKIKSGDTVLDLGCGYGRIIPQLVEKAGTVIGIDSSMESLRLGREILADSHNHHLLCIDAASLGFRDNVFDVVICIQNGISAFHVNQTLLIRESVRVVKPGGTVLFSSYSDKFWADRLEWFELQAKEGLLGEIDYEKTGDGIIVCRDGFAATTVSEDRFLDLTAGLNADVNIVEIDNSSLFCEINPR